MFRHLVDVKALWHTSEVFESSSNKLKLFFTMPTNSNRIIRSFILKEKQGKLPRPKNGLRRGKKNNFLHLLSILVILKVRKTVNLYLLYIS